MEAERAADDIRATSSASITLDHNPIFSLSTRTSIRVIRLGSDGAGLIWLDVSVRSI